MVRFSHEQPDLGHPSMHRGYGSCRNDNINKSSGDNSHHNAYHIVVNHEDREQCFRRRPDYSEKIYL